MAKDTQTSKALQSSLDALWAAHDREISKPGYQDSELLREICKALRATAQAILVDTRTAEEK